MADASRARSRLGWEPTISFSELVALMVEADLAKESLSLEQARARVADGEVPSPV